MELLSSQKMRDLPKKREATSSLRFRVTQLRTENCTAENCYHPAYYK
jgi:hypothetical protein